MIIVRDQLYGHTTDCGRVIDDSVIDELGMPIIPLIMKTGLFSSNSDVRRNMKAGAIRINDERIYDETARLVKVGEKIFIIIRKAVDF